MFLLDRSHCLYSRIRWCDKATKPHRRPGRSPIAVIGEIGSVRERGRLPRNGPMRQFTQTGLEMASSLFR